MRLKRCSMQDFNSELKNKKIACYGIGDEFGQIIASYADEPWIDKIGYLVDGNPGKWGMAFRIRGKEYKVIDLQELRRQDMEEIILFPTCAAFVEVIDGLNKVPWLDGVECYVFHCMFHLGGGALKSIRQTDRMLIPPNIHYCWLGGKPLPDRYQRYMESWKKFCPDYEIIKWNESNIDINETDYTREAYAAGKYGFVSDYFRLKIIYEHGGIYLDTDVELVRSLDDLRYNEAFCGMEFPGRVNTGLGFGAVKHNRMIQGLMYYYKSKHFRNGDGSFDETTCPIIQSGLLRSFGMRYGASLQMLDGLAIYPVDVLSPKNVYTGEIVRTENTYAIHHYDGSWVSESDKDVRKKKQENAARILEQFG